MTMKCVGINNPSEMRMLGEKISRIPFGIQFEIVYLYDNSFINIRNVSTFFLCKLQL